MIVRSVRQGCEAGCEEGWKGSFTDYMKSASGEEEVSE